MAGIRSAPWSEARTPEEDTIDTADDRDRSEAPAGSESQGSYDGPDPEDDPTGDGSDEDQGT
jgi:hypothetical protein